MITKLEIENFKALRGKHEIPIAPITLIYGPNSAGKSSVIQALLLLKQSIDAGRFTARGPLVDLGSFHSCVWKHDYTKPIRIGITTVAALGIPMDEWDNEDSWSFSGSAGLWVGFVSRKAEGGSPNRVRLDTVRFWRESGAYADGLDVRLRYAPAGRRRIHSNRYNLTGARTKAWLKQQFDNDGQPATAADINQCWVSLGKNLLPDDIQRPFRTASDRADHPDLPPVAFGIGPAAAATAALSECRRRVQSVLDGVRYIGPLRTRPTRTFSPVEAAGDWVGVAGENTSQLLMDGLAEGIGSPHCYRFLEWLKDMDIPYKVEVIPIGDQLLGDGIRTTLFDKRTKIKVGLADVGSGVGQVLPLLAQGAFGGAQVMCVEQPELHLHPRAQAALGDILIECSRIESPQEDWADATQWIVETHSETLLLRIKRRIREKRLPPEAVCVLYVNPGKSGSVVTRLRLDERGDFIDEWPSGFFEEAFNEVFS